jgi:hypothetical protein
MVGIVPVRSFAHFFTTSQKATVLSTRMVSDWLHPTVEMH